MESKLSSSVEQIINPNKTLALGNDLVFLPDFTRSLNQLFINKVYTPQEISYCTSFSNATLHYASTWAAKEAVYKAVKQLDPSPLAWKKIEITRKKTGGEPVVTLHQHAGRFTVSLTISHDGDYVWAAAIVEAHF